MNRTSDARWIVDQLSARFGAISESTRDPVEMLVLTILSQNTTDTNRDRAYVALIHRFGTLNAVAHAKEEEIADAIRVGGLQRQKARSIRQSLGRVPVERGQLDLGFLERMETADALAWLLTLPGVGRKTAGIVLLFAFNKPYFPIDTHIRRVLQRLGWVHGKEEPHRRVNALLDEDPELMVGLHLQLIRLGRTLCRPRKPQCGGCPIRARCDYAKESAP